MSLVQAVLDGNEESERIFIQDTIRCNARALLKHGVCELLKRYDKVHLLLCDLSKEQWVKGLSTDTVSRLCMHNYTYGLQDKNAHTLMSEVSSAVNASQGKTVLVIDSLSSLLLFLPLALCHAPPAPIVCRWLLSMHPHHILALLHSDLHEEGVVLQLNSIAVSSMKVIPANPTTSQFTGIVNTIHKRLSGKVLKQMESYSVVANCISMETTTVLSSETHTTCDKADPAANLTFDLHLSSREKEARSQVILPYTKAQQEGLVGVASQGGSGQIYYQPDEMDDFDDSDPDDDLEF